MKTAWLAVVLMMAACNTIQDPELEKVELQARVQSALDGVTGALRARDMVAFKSFYRPNQNEPESMAQLLMDTQREGLNTHYGDKAPQIVELTEEPGGIILARVYATKFERVSPKPVYFWRDPADGKIYWTGITRHVPDDPRGVVRQAAWNPEIKPYDVWNQASVGHYWHTHSHTDQALSCYQSGACLVAEQIAPAPLGGQLSAGWSGYVYVNANVNGSQYAVARINPANGTCNCSSYTSTSTGSCCWVHAWGWDFWWPGSSSSQADNATCGASGSC